jgi:MoxR-like ATPase
VNVTAAPLAHAPDFGDLEAGPPYDAQRAAATHVAQALVLNVERVVRGRRAAVELVVCGVMSGGHVLVEDVPGSGKTTLAKAVARSIGGTFRRVQATADLLPSDITGSGVWDGRGLAFVPGPLFANVVLVDELNRTPPRTQSAFLEAMEEGAVTVDGVRHPLPAPFVLLATQNPLDQHGTYALPEGQLDRFTVCLHLGPLDAAAERLVVREQLEHATVDDLTAVTDPDTLRAVTAEVRRTYVSDPVLAYAVELARATREDPAVRHGASARAALALVRCAQALSVLRGTDHVGPDEVKALAFPVLTHRVTLADGRVGGAGAVAVIQASLQRVAVPPRP